MAVVEAAVVGVVRQMKLVIAGTFFQYQDWLRESRTLTSKARYVWEKEQLQGYHPEDVEIVLAGEYWRNEAYTYAKERGLLDE